MEDGWDKDIDEDERKKKCREEVEHIEREKEMAKRNKEKMDGKTSRKRVDI